MILRMIKLNFSVRAQNFAISVFVWPMFLEKSLNQTILIRVRLDITYFAKNWKRCSKIIFKYMNSIVGVIFNENVAEKWS